MIRCRYLAIGTDFYLAISTDFGYWATSKTKSTERLPDGVGGDYWQECHLT